MTGSTLHPVADQKAAEALDKRLRAQASAIVYGVDRWAPLVEQAKAGQIWRPLGFMSWPQYIADVIATSLGKSKLTIDKRRELVATLTEAGMSQRAIASGLGVDPATVNRDLGVLRNATPVDLDAPEASERFVVEKVTAEPSRPITAVEGEKVTGLDGKSYPPPQPKPETREPSAAEAEAERLTRFCRRIALVACEADGLGLIPIDPDKARDFADRMGAALGRIGVLHLRLAAIAAEGQNSGAEHE
jgi:hypothetical protein